MNETRKPNLYPVGDETPQTNAAADMYKDKLDKLQEDYDLLMKGYIEAKQKIKNLTAALKNIAAAM